jgi:hypothetical protein
MPDPWVPERGRLFLRELAAQLATGTSPNCNDVADAIGMDENESAQVMHWLTLESLVREVGQVAKEVPHPYTCDPYAMGPLEVTPRGSSFMDAGQLPAEQVKQVEHSPMSRPDLRSGGPATAGGRPRRGFVGRRSRRGTDRPG